MSNSRQTDVRSQKTLSSRNNHAKAIFYHSHHHVVAWLLWRLKRPRFFVGKCKKFYFCFLAIGRRRVFALQDHPAANHESLRKNVTLLVHGAGLPITLVDGTANQTLCLRLVRSPRHPPMAASFRVPFKVHSVDTQVDYGPSLWIYC